MRHADRIARMTPEEKVALGSGLGYWQTKPLSHLNLPSLFMADGPHGLRKQDKAGDHLGLEASVKATCFPTASALAASWDPELLYEIGSALGREARALGVNIILGPGVNMKRNPLCGRNFEYFSEDPLLSGALAAAWIQGAQAQGAGASLKHFACNNQETGRLGSDSLVDERALREYYLPAFERAVREAQPATVMCSYNRINGIYASDNRWLLTELLRGEWGFEGAVISDWGATHDRVAGIAAGLDLEMPDSHGRFDREVLAALREGRLDKALLDRMVSRLMDLAERWARPEDSAGDQDLFTQHNRLARQAAARCAVLLKNEDSFLPLDPGQPLTVIGELARTPRYQGSGSSMVTPTALGSLLDGLTEHGVPLAFAPGYSLEDVEDEALAQEALALAEQGGRVLLCIGLTALYESEGYDRDSLALPKNQVALLTRLQAKNPDLAVVTVGGSAFEMPWLHLAKAVLHLHLAGQAGGLAAADLLLGKANPCGKLAETWPLAYADVVSSPYYGKVPAQAPYFESFYAGYRYFDSADKEVLFPFGFGLSYTRFSYHDLRLEELGGDGLTASFRVRNEGSRAGAETAQLYVAPQTGGVYRPRQELKAFSRVYLEPGEEREVVLRLDARSFSVYSPQQKQWQVEAGCYLIRVGGGSRDIRLEQALTLPGVPAGKSDCAAWYYTLQGTPGKQEFQTIYGEYAEPVPPAMGRYTLDHSIRDMAGTSLVCRLVLRWMEREVARNTGLPVDYRNPQFRMLMDAAAAGPLNSLTLFVPDQMPLRKAQLIVDLANGHPLRGILRFLRSHHP